MSAPFQPLLMHKVKTKSLEYKIEIVQIQDPFQLRARYVHQLTLVEPASSAGEYIARVAYDRPVDLSDHEVAWFVSQLRKQPTLKTFLAANFWERIPNRTFVLSPSRRSKGVYFISTSMGAAK